MPPVDPDAVARRSGPPSTTDEIRNRMRANSAGRDTGPEMAVRRALRRMGARYRVGPRIELPGRRAVKPDLAWKQRRLAVFIDGCFWHCCPDHHTPPKTNLDYWLPKLERNVDRDIAQTRALWDLGWVVLRFWEHEDPEVIARVIWYFMSATQPPPGGGPRWRPDERATELLVWALKQEIVSAR